MLFYSAVRIGSYPNRTDFYSRKSLLLLFLTGLIHAVGAQTLETTSLTACVNASIALPGNDPSRKVKRSWWKARYQDGPWIEIGHCVKTRGCINSTTVLPDGTRAWVVGINERLIVERSSDLRNTTAQFQFLVEDNLKRRHIFKVNFTVYCKLLRLFSLSSNWDEGNIRVEWLNWIFEELVWTLISCFSFLGGSKNFRFIFNCLFNQRVIMKNGEIQVKLKEVKSRCQQLWCAVFLKSNMFPNVSVSLLHWDGPSGSKPRNEIQEKVLGRNSSVLLTC